MEVPNIPISRRDSPAQPSSLALIDKFLGMSVSPVSAQTLSCDTADADDEIDEQELWGIDTSNSASSSYEGEDVSRRQASVIPRIVSASRIVGSRSTTPERHSPLRDAGFPRVSSVVNSWNSISSPPNGFRSPASRILSVEGSARRIPPASRMIPRSTIFQASRDGPGSMIPQSAPVNIPDWSKVHGRMDKKLVVDDDQDDEEEGMLPPHEFLSRQYAESQTTSSSVLEGAGRTLKGRDMSRVRNAVLSYTGFLD